MCIRDSITPETEKEAKEEIKQEKKAPVVPELDAAKWKDCLLYTS